MAFGGPHLVIGRQSRSKLRHIAVVAMVAGMTACATHHAAARTTTTTTSAPVAPGPQTVGGKDRPVDHGADGLCTAAIHALDDQGYGWTGDQIATALQDGDAAGGTKTRWVICRGEPAGGVGVVVARSGDGNHWLTRALPIPPNHHAGDDVYVDFAGAGHVYLTYDSLVASEEHRHVFTQDDGVTWLVLAQKPMDARELDGP
ncbi:MAG TPA: hypothetical protein VHD87_15805 [Acidimicrobiales bacterium]|nr:hypothetical protein [Acidimicrobiales bacterium]